MPVAPVGSGSAPRSQAADAGYTVKAGDTLTAIAQAHGVSLAALERANPQILHPDLIYPGQHLNLPEGGQPAAGAGGDYTVRSGDTLSAIGDRFGVDWRTLAQVNRLSDPDLILVGQHLQIPGGAPSPATGGGGSVKGGAPAGTVGAPAGTVSARAQQAVSYFESQGWSHAQAAGIVANLQTESGLTTNVYGDGGAAYGMAQWHGDRQAVFAQVFGHSIKGSSFEEQLKFVQYELTHTESGAGSQLKGATSASEAGAIVSRAYERPLAADAEASKRGALAAQIFAQTH